MHFTWSASGGDVYSNISGGGEQFGTWTAPETEGSYTLTCTVDDTGTTRYNDAAETASITITVDSSAPTLTLASTRSTLVAGPGCDYNHTTLTATLKNPDNTPMANQSITFTLNQGAPATLTDATVTTGANTLTVTTDANGQAKVTLSSRDEYGVTVEVIATHAGVEGRKKVDIEPPDGSVLVKPRSTPLIADGQSIADVILTLKYGGKPVLGHSILWRISKVLDAEGKEVTTPGDDYGTLVESDKLPNSDGEYFRKFITGTKPGTIFFQAVDKSVKKYKAPSQSTSSVALQENADGDEENPVFDTSASDQADVTPPLPKVTFKETLETAYGFDDYTPSTATLPLPTWISVEVGQSSETDAVTDPADQYASTFFKSTNNSITTPNVAQATLSPQLLEVSGHTEGVAAIEANHGSHDGPQIGKLNVAVYRRKRRNLAIRVVHEENDDVQVIPFMGAGEPHEICVRAGANGFRDTVPAEGDAWDATGLNITTGQDGICQTQANNQNVLTNLNFTAGQLKTYLDDVFKQAVLDWDVVVLPPVTTNFDLDRDGGLDTTYKIGKPYSDEAQRVIAAGRDDDDEIDEIIFLVSNPRKGANGGYFPFGLTHGFVHMNSMQVVAHELGHGAFELTHTTEPEFFDATKDPSNLMFPYTDTYRTRLRANSNQWNMVNKNTHNRILQQPVP